MKEILSDVLNLVYSKDMDKIVMPTNEIESVNDNYKQSFVFCSNCGSKNDNGDNFCYKCGNKLKIIK